MHLATMKSRWLNVTQRGEDSDRDNSSGGLMFKTIFLWLFATAAITAVVCSSENAVAQAWRNCIPNSIGPGGCDSIGPGGGQSIGPGGGMSIGPGGGLSIGPGGGQSIGPGGGQSIGPGGGQAIDRDRSRGLNPDTMRPYDTGIGSPSPMFIPPTFTPTTRPILVPYSNGGPSPGSIDHIRPGGCNPNIQICTDCNPKVRRC